MRNHQTKKARPKYYFTIKVDRVSEWHKINFEPSKKTYYMWQYQSAQEAPLYQPQTFPEPAFINPKRLKLRNCKNKNNKQSESSAGKLIPYIIKNIRVRCRWNKCNCQTFGAKPTSSANLCKFQCEHSKLDASEVYSPMC